MLPRKFLCVLKSPRAILSVITVVVLFAVIYLSRDELYKAWTVLGQANIWLILLLVPFQIVVYFAGGEMIFSYLRDKNMIKNISYAEQTRISLELNLVNHIFPSGGVSGISYTTWRMRNLGVSSASATFAQALRYLAGFVSLTILLLIAVVLLIINGNANNHIIAASFLFIAIIVFSVAMSLWMFSSKNRLCKMADNITKIINFIVSLATFGRIKQLMSASKIRNFFVEMQNDFHELMQNKQLLIKPLVWGAVYAIFDVAMFYVAFLSLGVQVSPEILLIGYGLSGLAGFLFFTPGGAGAYEVIMIFFLSMSGVAMDVAIAGIVLTRAILLAGTIVFGYAFYQHAVIKYGKPRDSKISC